MARKKIADVPGGVTSKPDRELTDSIEIPERLRGYDEGIVQKLMASIEANGLIRPIAVRWVGNDSIVLVAGRHRLEAVRRLGWPMIDCMTLDGTDDAIAAWVAAESMRRPDVTVPIHLIECGSRIREVSPAHVAALVGSIKDVGLLHPITVRRHSVLRNGRVGPGFKLVSGLHRLEAFKAIGETDIPVQILELNELEAIVAECDENLCGTSLSQAERSLFTRKRKEAYEALHPETKAGRAQANGMNASVGNNVAAKSAATFAADAAMKTGQSERTVRLDAQRGESIPEPILKEIAGTELDKGVVLDRLVKADDAEAELTVIRKERDGARRTPRNMASVTRATAEQRFAEWLVRRAEPAELAEIMDWLRTVRPAGVIEAMQRGWGDRGDQSKDQGKTFH